MHPTPAAQAAPAPRATPGWTAPPVTSAQVMCEAPVTDLGMLAATRAGWCHACRPALQPPKPARTALSAACATNWYLRGGECFPCIGAATSLGQLDTTCSCAASYTYSKESYVHLAGCACSTGYTATSANCTHSAAGWYKVYGDGESADNSIGVSTRCPGGATSTAGASPLCTCAGLGSAAYNTSVAFDAATGCTCAEGYAKPAGHPGGECSQCQAGYEYKSAAGGGFTCTKCSGAKVSDGTQDNSCKCPSTEQYSGQANDDGCGEHLLARGRRMQLEAATGLLACCAQLRCARAPVVHRRRSRILTLDYCAVCRSAQPATMVTPGTRTASARVRQPLQLSLAAGLPSSCSQCSSTLSDRLLPAALAHPMHGANAWPTDLVPPFQSAWRPTSTCRAAAAASPAPSAPTVRSPEARTRPVRALPPARTKAATQTRRRAAVGCPGAPAAIIALCL